MKEKIKEYLAWKATYARKASINYRIWLERFVEICGEKELLKYDISDYTKYQLWIETRYSPSSTQLATVVLKNFFMFCVHNNYPCLSPTLIRTRRIIAKSHRAITEDEFERIIAEIPRNEEFSTLRDKVVIRLLWDTGMRVSELCDLDLTQITETKRSAVIYTKKTLKKRVIVWSEETHLELMKYMVERLQLHNVNKANALLLGWAKGKAWSSRMSSRTVQRIIKHYVNRAGIKEKITPHSFRHGWAHKRRDQNAPLSFIQRGLGHLSPVSTFIYEQYNDLEFVQNAENYLQGSGLTG